MASSAIPFLFPHQIYNHDTYVDGGLFSNEILNGFLDQCSIAGMLKDIEINMFLTQTMNERVDTFTSNFQVLQRIAGVWLGLEYSELEIYTGTCNK